MAGRKVITLTPELAQHYLDNAGPNAPLKRDRVEKYKAIIRNGEWALSFHDGTRTREAPPLAVPKGKLIDGQHRCTAVVETGIPIPVYIQVYKKSAV